MSPNNVMFQESVKVTYYTGDVLRVTSLSRKATYIHNSTWLAIVVKCTAIGGYFEDPQCRRCRVTWIGSENDSDGYRAYRRYCHTINRAEGGRGGGDDYIDPDDPQLYIQLYEDNHYGLKQPKQPKQPRLNQLL